MEKRKRKSVSFYSSQQWDKQRAKRSRNDDDEFYEVESIQQMRLFEGKLHYYIKWKGYPEEFNTWEPHKHLANCPQALKDFERSQQALVAAEVNAEVKAEVEGEKALPPLLAAKPHQDLGSPSLQSTVANHVAVEKILKAMSYSTRELSNGEKDLNVTFKVLRSDGEEILLDNKYLRENYPQLLLDFYEQRVRNVRQ
ncbi:chromo domain-containing protein LHP1-like [Selaginella moellendorffii]|uniref:chromo domain-containing protein LHP1-like n=1 Tax=Selaginella moellendorffii TaxID=88036 RepID=UPI000D1CE7DF|nr:chromo domain-containing protein LHP1-like [Selaginella moellendorffii]|eukprot:XP_024521250.1 chromo domain-containing protein LHP1-like [Selaginella moellendorffii]